MIIIPNLIASQHALDQISERAPEILAGGEVVLVDEQDVLLEGGVEVGLEAELADDGDVVARLKRQYDVLAETTPSTVLLPWLPTPAMVRKLCATKVIYDTVVAALDARERGGCARDDTMQLLLDAGDDRATVIGVSGSLILPPSSPLIWFDAVHYGPLGRRRARDGDDRELAGRLPQRLP